MNNMSDTKNDFNNDEDLNWIGVATWKTRKEWPRQRISRWLNDFGMKDLNGHAQKSKRGISKVRAMSGKLHRFRIKYNDGTIRFVRSSTFGLASLSYGIKTDELKADLHWEIVAE
jgi:hypothetical protein